MDERDQVLVPVAEPLGQSPTSRFSESTRRPFWIDALVLLVIAILIFLLFRVTRTMTAPRREKIVIDLSPWLLPKYVGWSLFRSYVAFGFSLLFTFIYGYIAANSRKAERFMIPILDILQSIPVLGFLPSLMLAFLRLFPNSNFGIEMVSIIMIFTGQVWNMTFSFYHSLKTIPTELKETSAMYGFSWWQRFWKLEVPYSMIPLVWNAKMSMAGGWFFLTVCEAFQLGTHDFRLPGIGSYMSVASLTGNTPAILYGITAMVLTIILVDQIFWRPIIAWAQKFKYEETTSGESVDSVILDVIRQSVVVAWLGKMINILREIGIARAIPQFQRAKTTSLEYFRQKPYAPTVEKGVRIVPYILLVAVLVLLGYGTYLFLKFISILSFHQWTVIVGSGGLTLLRVILALLISSLWAIPLGVLIGLKPRLSQILQPIIQILASFPAPMIYPLIVYALVALHIPMGIGSIFLLILGTQWYILFNATAGAVGVPNELVEASMAYRFSPVQRWLKLYLPAVSPSLITGWLVAAGGAWNASIVAEYQHLGDQVLSAHGLGAMISLATVKGQMDILAGGVLVMVFFVILLNRFFWDPLFHYVSERYSLSKS